MKRVWHPLVRCSQDEAKTEEIALEGPDISLTRLSDDSFPSLEKDEEEEEEKKQQRV